MRPRQSVSRAAVEMIKAFEGFRAKAARLDDGRWTIGYGHTLTAREGAEIGEADAEALLLYDLIQAAHAVNEYVYAPITQNQFDALVSFVFNIGARQFRGSPTLRRLNEGRPLDAALAMELWRKADLEGERIVIDALVRRRAAEKALFLKPEEGYTPAPTPILPPKIDYDAVGIIPLTSPVAARAAMDGNRAYAERAPATPTPRREDDAPASAAAAQAVISRLESLLNEPEKPLPGRAPAASGQTPADVLGPLPEPPSPRYELPDPTPVQPVNLGLPPITVMGAKTRPSWLNTVLMAFFFVVGVGMLCLAALWGFQSDSEQVFGVSPRTAGLVVGLLGIAAFSVAAYMLLERLGGPRNGRMR